MNDEFSLELSRRIREGSVFITGFHGIGFVGWIAVTHLIKILKAEKIGYVISQDLPPYAVLDKGRLSLPFEIFAAGRYVFFKSNLPIEPRQASRLTKKLAEWVVDESFKEAILIGGLDSRLKGESGDFKVVSTTAYAEKNSLRDWELLEDGLYIVGPLALLLNWFEIMDFPALVVLPYANTERVDPLAASIAVRFISEMYGLKIDVAELEARAEELERELLEAKKRMEEALEKERSTRLFYV